MNSSCIVKIVEDISTLVLFTTHWKFQRATERDRGVEGHVWIGRTWTRRALCLGWEHCLWWSTGINWELSLSRLLPGVPQCLFPPLCSMLPHLSLNCNPCTRSQSSHYLDSIYTPLQCYLSPLIAWTPLCSPGLRSSACPPGPYSIVPQAPHSRVPWGLHWGGRHKHFVSSLQHHSYQHCPLCPCSPSDSRTPTPPSRVVTS